MPTEATDGSAYPGDLGSHLRGVPTDFQTDAAACAFGDYFVSQGWIDGLQ